MLRTWLACVVVVAAAAPAGAQQPMLRYRVAAQASQILKDPKMDSLRQVIRSITRDRSSSRSLSIAMDTVRSNRSCPMPVLVPDSSRSQGWQRMPNLAPDASGSRPMLTANAWCSNPLFRR
jgi:hypothetical protein